MISIVINCDNRIGYKENKSTVGDFGEGSLQGVRSTDFLLDGVINKMNYFRGYDTQCIVFLDEHEPLPNILFTAIDDLVKSYGNNSKLIVRQNNRSRYRWNDYLYIEALKFADGNYVAHFDQDAAAIRVDDSEIIEKYLAWLDLEYKFICQPTDLTKEVHGMFWASSRFFICKKETLNFNEIEANITSPLKGRHTPCFEHIISVLNDEKVLYPPRQDDKYIVFSWARYFSGTLKRLNEMQPEKALEYIFNLGLHGANDIIDKLTENE